MKLEHRVLESLRRLPEDKQQEVLDFVEFLARKLPPPPPRQSMMGIFADAGVDITREDIDEMRREAWGNFPRELE